MSIKIELSVGELLDKISILQIKIERIDDPSKLVNIKKELDVLLTLWGDSDYSNHDLESEKNKLKVINDCLLYTSPSPRDRQKSRMPSSA